jgi:DNA-directed RNA polymerase subunit RPC12/RpoP
MPKCPNCTAHMKEPDKEWDFGRFRVKMYKCTKCGNQFREFFKRKYIAICIECPYWWFRKD